MEWVKNCNGNSLACCRDLYVSVFYVFDKWWYSVVIKNVEFVHGNTDTEERAKYYAVEEAYRIIRDLVSDLAEITGENYHLEFN